MVINIKKVGIILREFNENNKEFLGTRNDLFKTLEEFNLILIGIPQNNNIKNIINTITLCDGIILPGGETFTDNDFKIIKYLYENDIPTLGICLGMQSIATFFGNSKEEPLNNHYSSKKYVHYLNIQKNTLLYKIIKKDKILVNSRHHFHIPKTNLKINALTNDNIIEGIEAPDKKFFLGVLYHPESLNDANSYRLFKYFVDIL